MPDASPQGELLDPPRAFAAALDLFKLGRGDDAEAAALALIGHEPRHAGALHLLGIIDLQRGRVERALGRLRASVAEEPEVAEAQCSLGAALDALGRRDEATAALECAIALKPDYAEAYNNLGNALTHQGKTERAIAVYRHALALKPDFVEAQINLGRALAANGDIDAAIAAFRQSTALDPGNAESHRDLGAALWDARHIDEAIAANRQAVALDPGDAKAYCNLGVALGERGDIEPALAAFGRAVALKPDYAEAHSNMGEALRRGGRFDAAVVAFRSAIAARARYADAYANMGHTLKQAGRLDEAISAYREAIAIQPTRAEYHGSLAFALLATGNFAEGWDEYEWRWQTPEFPPRPFSQPLWAGEDVGDRVLLLQAEQGFGDTIQFCRYVPLVAQRANVVLQVTREVGRLLSSLDGVTRMVAFGDDPPPFDLHCSFMSLPKIFGTTLETVPNKVPYLAADAGDVARWRTRLAPLAGRKVGLVWRSSPGQIQNPGVIRDREEKSMRLAHLAPLATVPDVSFVSLQKADAGGETPPSGLVIHDWTAEIGDFADTAAAIEAVDLVISIDTSVAHLAGALGKPVWLMDRCNTDWRWLRDRTDSPWYPTMRIFRQQTADDWDGVVATVAAALRDWSPDRAKPARKAPRVAKAKPARVPRGKRAVTPAPVAEPSRDVRPAEVLRWPIVFTWGVASSFGWGIVGLNLALNLADDAELLPICASPIDPGNILIDAVRRRRLDPVLANARTFADRLASYRDCTVKLSCPVLHALGNGFSAGRLAGNLELRGSTEIGLFFIEDTAIDAAARERAKRHSLLVAGSRWNQRLVAAEALDMPVELALQGVDLSVFHPGPKTGLFKDRFVVFSGGKLEYRKGQDLVLLAFRAFRERHPEALLVCAWHSPWNGLASGLAVNARVAPVPFKGAVLDVAGWAAANGLPADSVVDLGPVPNFQMPPILRECDVALFPNRAEGGTNLVAMECMACGVPSIVSANTGHLDLIAGESCWPLERQGRVAATDAYAGTDGWGESDVDEMVAALETLWQDRERAARIGSTGAALMTGWGWPEQIGRLKQVLLPHLRETLASDENARKIVLEPLLLVPAVDAPADAPSGDAMVAPVPVSPQEEVRRLFTQARERQTAGDPDGAMRLYCDVLSRAPAFPDALNNLAVMLKGQKHYRAAVAYLRRALDLVPGSGALHSNLGNMLWMAQEYDAAAIAFRHGIEIDPNRPETHHNLGLLQFSLGDYKAAIASYDRSLALGPENRLAQWDRALALLADGDYARGFAAYDVRFDLDDATMGFDRRLSGVRSLPLPLWQGEDIAGRTLYVYAEQGLGDTLQFVRFLPLAAAQGARIVFDSHAELLGLLRDFPGIAELRPQGSALPAADFHAPLLSLPNRLGMTRDTLPAQVPYLRVAPSNARLVRLPTTKLAAGVVWAGRAAHTNDKNRSIALGEFFTLCDLPGLGLYSLQKGERAADIAAEGAGALLNDLAPHINDFVDTARLVMQLDLVITVDTAVAHLAGALGKPVFILLPFTPDWRWMGQRPDTPWYPTARLFRQKSPGDWKGVMADLREALRLMLT